DLVLVSPSHVLVDGEGQEFMYTVPLKCGNALLSPGQGFIKSLVLSVQHRQAQEALRRGQVFGLDRGNGVDIAIELRQSFHGMLCSEATAIPPLTMLVSRREFRQVRPLLFDQLFVSR